MSGAPPATFRPREWACVLAVSLVGATLCLQHGYGMRGLHLDSIYYLAAARGVADHLLPEVPWPQGPQSLYFPGYPFLLGLFCKLLWLDPRGSFPIFNAAMYGVLAWRLPSLLGPLLRHRGATLAATLLTISNPILLRWVFIPMTEPAALALAVAGAGLLLGAHDHEGRFMSARWREVLGIVLLGLAAATRAEYVVLSTMLVGPLWLRRRDDPASALRTTPGTFALLALMGLPLVVWKTWLALGTETSHLYYVDQATRNFSWDGVVGTIVFLAQFQFDLPNIEPMSAWSSLLGLSLSFTLFAALLVALRGRLGPRMQVCGAFLVFYWVAHGFWFYRSERFNILTLPLVAALLADFALWLVDDRRRRLARPAKAILAALLAILVVTRLSLGDYLARHMIALFDNERSPMPRIKLAASWLEAEKGEVRTLTNMPMESLLLFPGTTWCAYDQPTMFAKPYDESTLGQFLRDEGVTHLVLDCPVRQWLAAEHAPNLAGMRITPEKSWPGVFVYLVEE